MPVTIEISAGVLARLEAEAARRGITLDQLIEQLAEVVVSPSGQDSKPRLSFIGIGHSGLGDLSRRHREIRAEQTSEMTARDF